MKTIDNIIKECIDRYLIREFHHVTVGSLEDEADSIYQQFVSMIESSNSYDEGVWYRIDSLNYNIKLILTDSVIGSAIDVFNHHLKFNETNLIKSLNDISMQNKCKSLIYHELGHLVQRIKSDSSQILSMGVKTPLFLKMNEKEYNEIRRILYRFEDRELKARCYETYMLLKQNRESGKNMMSIKDVYDNRCSDITLMRDFIDRLKVIQGNGSNSDEAYIIDGLYRETYSRNRWDRRSKYIKDFNKRANRVINYFQLRLDWLTKRINKIYSDFIVK